MISVPIHNRQGEQVGRFEFDEAALGGHVHKVLLREAVLMYEANRRVGTASTKTRGEVAGSRSKLFRQKGTGRARVGSRVTNKRRGGGTAKGPRPRDYSYHLPRKALRRATQSALLSKFLDEEAVVIDALNVPAPRTQDVVAILGALGIDQSCLIVTDGVDVNVYKSARNLPRTWTRPHTELNAYDLLRGKRLLVTLDAISRLTGQPRDGGQQ